MENDRYRDLADLGFMLLPLTFCMRLAANMLQCIGAHHVDVFLADTALGLSKPYTYLKKHEKKHFLDFTDLSRGNRLSETKQVQTTTFIAASR